MNNPADEEIARQAWIRIEHGLRYEGVKGGLEIILAAITKSKDSGLIQRLQTEILRLQTELHLLRNAQAVTPAADQRPFSSAEDATKSKAGSLNTTEVASNPLSTTGSGFGETGAVASDFGRKGGNIGPC